MGIERQKNLSASHSGNVSQRNNKNTICDGSKKLLATRPTSKGNKLRRVYMLKYCIAATKNDKCEDSVAAWERTQ